MENKPKTYTIINWYYDEYGRLINKIKVTKEIKERKKRNENKRS
ncbi:MAG: hypothetical protein R3Y05_05825 [bacterium]